MNSSYNHTLLGLINIIIKPKNKYLRIKVKEKCVELIIPNQALLNSAKDLLENNIDKILKIQAKHKSSIRLTASQDNAAETLTQAKQILPARVEYLAQKYNFSYSSIRIMKMKTRWGSCSAKKSIHLSCYLVKVPQHLIDYVIIHELCHTKQMNHSDKFWTEVANIYPNYKQLRAELRQYRFD